MHLWRSRETATFLLLLTALILFFPPLFFAKISVLPIAVLALIVVGFINTAQKTMVPRKINVPYAYLALLILIVTRAIYPLPKGEQFVDAVTLIALAYLAWLTVSRINGKDLIFLFVAATLVLWGLSFFYSLLNGQPLVNAIQDGWYGNRNGLGFVLLPGFAASMARIPNRQVNRFVLVGTSCIIFVLILATESVSSIVAALTCVAAWLLLLLCRRPRQFYAYALAGAVVVLTLCFSFQAVLLDLVGKSSSLSGRLPIWNAVWAQIKKYPLWGMGWDFAWPTDSELYYRVNNDSGGVIQHSHNEVLNWWVTLGLLGVVSILAIYWFVISRGLKLWFAKKLEVARWAVLTGVIFFVHGLADVSETAPVGFFVISIMVMLMVRESPTEIGSEKMFTPSGLRVNAYVSPDGR